MAGISEEAVNEVARNLFDGGDIDYTIERDGSAKIDTWNLPDVDNYEYSYGTVAKETLDKAIELLTKLISSVKFYVGDNGASLELNDNHTLWDINAPDEYEGEFDYDYYQYLVDQALDDFEERTGVEAHQDGRMGRHIVVDITFDNMTRFDELKAIQEELEADVIEKAEAECFPVVDGMTESLNKGEKKARCLSCGVDVIYTNRDVEHDIDGDYIECPNCHATFDVDYDAIEPLLNKKTEAEDMSKVKDDVKDAVEKSDSTEQEKDQVKGSIDVLKTDEESAIDGYEEFNKETSKVVDKELADTIDDQMQEIVDDEKEHIEKLDTIKSALGESKKSSKKLDYKLDGFKGVNIVVVDKKNNINAEEYLDFDSMEFGIDEYEFEVDMKDGIKDILSNLYEYTDAYYDDVFTENEITEMAEDITQDVLQLYDDLPDELIDFENGIADLSSIKSTLDESKEAPRLTGDETYVARNSSGYKSIGLIIDNTNKQFQIINGQVMTTDSKTKKMSKKQIRDKAQQLYDNGYTEYNGYGSVAQGVNKKEELFNNDVNINVDAGDIASGNNLDLGGLGALAGLMASEETKKSDDKLEEATTGDVIRENLNTGVLRIIDVDMYSLNDEIPERATQEGLDEIIQDIAPKYLKEVIQEVLPSVEIYATGVYHPRQYNFSGDELEFDLVANKEEYEALKEKVTSDENFNAYLRNNYKSYDGFISYMADDISEFETQDTWKQLVQVIMFALGDEDNFGPIRNEYLDEFLDRVHTEFGWDDEEDDELDESKKVEEVTPEAQKVSFYTFRVAEEMYNSEHEDTWQDLDDDTKAEYYNEHFPTIFKLAKQRAENKKEELFNNTLDVNVNANDIASNNNLDLGGLGDLLGMTEAKAIEMKKTENKEEVNN